MLGVGIDAVEISRMEKFQSEDPFIKNVFTDAEREAEHGDFARYYATRFAVKEAVLKSMSQALCGEITDIRKIESLNAKDGSPYVVMNEYTKGLLEKAGAEKIHISITHEGGLAIAIAVLG